MPKMLFLSDEDFDILYNELHSLGSYHWNDDYIHADDCGSKIIDKLVIEAIEISSEEFKKKFGDD